MQVLLVLDVDYSNGSFDCIFIVCVNMSDISNDDTIYTQDAPRGCAHMTMYRMVTHVALVIGSLFPLYTHTARALKWTCSVTGVQLIFNVHVTNLMTHFNGNSFEYRSLSGQYLFDFGVNTKLIRCESLKEKYRTNIS